MINPHIERYRIIENHLGSFVLMLSDRGEVNSTWLTDDGWGLARISRASRDDRLLPELARQLRRYFGGEDADLSEALTPRGPAFSRRCWELCRQIPRGETRSYGDLARLAGRSPVAARAVGQAMRHNPLPVIVPCHRVIASDGSLHGFGGTSDPMSQPLELKRRLLELEGWVDPAARAPLTLFGVSSGSLTPSRAAASAAR